MLVDGVRLIGQLRAVLHTRAVQAVILINSIAATGVLSRTSGVVPVGRLAVVGQARQELRAELLFVDGWFFTS